MSEVYDKEYFEGDSKSNYGRSGGYGGKVIENVLGYATRLILRLLHPRSILDIGCAYGYVTKHIKQGLSYGIDISHHAIVESRLSDRVFLASGTHLPFKNKTFDVISCLETLEHLPEEEIDMVFDEVNRVGKKWFYMTTPSIVKHDDVVDDDITHITFFEREYWIKKGNSLGWLYDKQMTDIIMNFSGVKTVQWDCYVFNLTKGKV